MMRRSAAERVILALLVVIALSSAAFADTQSLWYNGVKKGTVETRANSYGGSDAAVDDAVSALGLARTGNSQGIVVVMSGKKMEFWSGSNIVRVCGTIVSLPEPVKADGGHWWADTKGLVKVFDLFYSSIGKAKGIEFRASDAQQGNEQPKAEEPAVQPQTQPKQKIQSNKEVKPKQDTERSADVQQPVEAVEPAVTIPAVTQVFKGKKRPLVVLDAGHGGHDPGAGANGIREKDINLSAVLQLEKALEAYGVNVRCSRKTDVFLKLSERTAFANNNNADVFVSLHCNAMPKGKHAAGLELYIMAPTRDKDSLQLAIAENKEISGSVSTPQDVQRADKKTRVLLKILGEMQQNDKISESTNLAEMLYGSAKSSSLAPRKVGQAPFFVLRGAGMPAVLIEMGYLTDASEAARLNSSNYRETLCRSIARGVVEYIREHPNETK